MIKPLHAFNINIFKEDMKMSEKKELSNEELLRKQEEKFEAYKKEQASKSKKRWLWGCGGCLGVFIILAILFSACTGAFVKEVDKEIKQEGTLKKDKKEEKAQTINDNLKMYTLA